MDLYTSCIFSKFEVRGASGYGVIWQPPFSASMAYKPQILIYVWFCTFDGYLKVFAIHPWRTDNKIMTLAYATSAISVSYDLNMRCLRRKANIFRKSVNNKFSSSQNMPFLKIWEVWALNSCSTMSSETRSGGFCHNKILKENLSQSGLLCMLSKVKPKNYEIIAYLISKLVIRNNR